MFRAGLYARVSTKNRQTLAIQNRAMRDYAARRGWSMALQVQEVNSGMAAEVREPRRSADDHPGTEASWSRVHFSHRGAGPNRAGGVALALGLSQV
jgi:Resolvase, N terminal domain